MTVLKGDSILRIVIVIFLFSCVEAISVGIRRAAIL